MKYWKMILSLSCTAALFMTSCSSDSSSVVYSPHGDFSSFKEKFEEEYPDGLLLQDGNYICNYVYTHVREGSVVGKTEKWVIGTYSFQGKDNLTASCSAVHLQTKEDNGETIVSTHQYFTGSSFYMYVGTVDWKNWTYSHDDDKKYGIDNAVLKGVQFNIETYYNDFAFVEDPSVTFYVVSSYVYEIDTLKETEETRTKTEYSYYFNADLSIREIRKTVGIDYLSGDESESYLWIFEPDEEELEITLPDDYLENPYESNQIGPFII